MNVWQANLRRIQMALDGGYPGIKWGAITECDWYSATFAGRRISIEFQLACELARKSANNLLDEIGDLEFILEEEFVADITVTVTSEEPHAINLRLDALLIEA